MDLILRSTFEMDFISFMLAIPFSYSFTVRRRKGGGKFHPKFLAVLVFKGELLELTCLQESAVDYMRKPSREL